MCELIPLVVIVNVVGYYGPKTIVESGPLFVDLDGDISANYLPVGRYLLVRQEDNDG